MADQVRVIKEIGGKGIVFGALTLEGKLDVNALKEIVQAADGQSITFHRAVDEALDPVVICKEIHRSELAVERILTSGGRSVVSEGTETIKKMMEVEKAGGPIIMPGSGLTVTNITEIHSELHAREYHVGSGVRHEGRYDMGIDPEKVAAFKKVITS